MGCCCGTGFGGFSSFGGRGFLGGFGNFGSSFNTGIPSASAAFTVGNQSRFFPSNPCCELSSRRFLLSADPCCKLRNRVPPFPAITNSGSVIFL